MPGFLPSCLFSSLSLFFELSFFTMFIKKNQILEMRNPQAAIPIWTQWPVMSAQSLAFTIYSTAAIMLAKYPMRPMTKPIFSFKALAYYEPLISFFDFSYLLSKLIFTYFAVPLNLQCNIESLIYTWNKRNFENGDNLECAKWANSSIN